MKTTYRFMGIVLMVSMISLCNCSTDKKEDATKLNREEIKSESLQETLDNLEKSEEELPADIQEDVKTEVEQIKKQKIESFQKAVEASPYKSLNDAEIREMLEKRLSEFSESCNMEIYTSIRKEMNEDEVLIQYNSNNRQYIKSFAGRLQDAHNSCRK